MTHRVLFPPRHRSYHQDDEEEEEVVQMHLVEGMVGEWETDKLGRVVDGLSEWAMGSSGGSEMGDG